MGKQVKKEHAKLYRFIEFRANDIADRHAMLIICCLE